MSENLRRTGGRNELNHNMAKLNSLVMLLCFAASTDPGIDDGTTAGTLKTTATSDHKIAGIDHTKAATDDFWDLSGETDNAAATYRAYWLYIDDAGAASFVASSSDQTSEALALADLPALDESKSVLGVFVAGPATDFDDAGGLAAQGTIYDGIPDGVPCGVPGKTYAGPQITTLVGA